MGFLATVSIAPRSPTPPSYSRSFLIFVVFLSNLGIAISSNFSVISARVSPLLSIPDLGEDGDDGVSPPQESGELGESGELSSIEGISSRCKCSTLINSHSAD